ncbi:hypothetical protein MRB53_020204 [Persea americana]|uniref:Uncharacterized protein n=1 Tax=Persea americana TaxID=3435 RepID=A0ACC2L1D6_PERAE|nr:hypothetical protein MRB53_020204 [Persea americana]
MGNIILQPIYSMAHPNNSLDSQSLEQRVDQSAEATKGFHSHLSKLSKKAAAASSIDEEFFSTCAAIGLDGKLRERWLRPQRFGDERDAYCRIMHSSSIIYQRMFKSF